MERLAHLLRSRKVAISDLGQETKYSGTFRVFRYPFGKRHDTAAPYQLTASFAPLLIHNRSRSVSAVIRKYNSTSLVLPAVV